MVNELSKRYHQTFDAILREDGEGQGFWLACDLPKVLDYCEFRHSPSVIERAREACPNSGQPIGGHIENSLNMVEIGSRMISELCDKGFECSAAGVSDRIVR